MQIVVTGSQSFIGRRFITLARAIGHSVSGLDSASGDLADIQVDIRDVNLAASIPSGTEAVVHLAAISRDGDCRSDPRSAFDVNVTGTLNVVRACRERRVRQLLFASTEWVYGDSSNGVQREDDPIDVGRVTGEYALTKLAAERALEMACPRDIASISILRFGIVYGPRAANWSAVESLADKVARGQLISVGSLATARRFIHVDDICSGIEAVLGWTGFDVFNLSGDYLVTLADIVAASARIHSMEPHITETNPGNASVRNPDNSKATTLLNWRPKIGLDAGLRSLIDHGALSVAQ